MSDQKTSNDLADKAPSDTNAGMSDAGAGKALKPGAAHDPNAPTPQGERAAEDQDDGAIPSPNY